MSPEDWITLLAPFDKWNERYLMATFSVFGVPRDYFDVGSGTGAMVNLARRLGVEAYGLDQIPRVDEWLGRGDLREAHDLGRAFDLVTCIETAEHVPPEFAATLADTVCRHVRPGGMLIWTAAGPGQSGDGHVNMQPAFYWRGLFWERDLQFKEERTHKLKLSWEMIRSPMFWLASNLQIFARRAPEEVYPGDGE